MSSQVGNELFSLVTFLTATKKCLLITLRRYIAIIFQLQKVIKKSQTVGIKVFLSIFA
jgi:hypothetical protein